MMSAQVLLFFYHAGNWEAISCFPPSEVPEGAPTVVEV